MIDDDLPIIPTEPADHEAPSENTPAVVGPSEPETGGETIPHASPSCRCGAVKSSPGRRERSGRVRCGRCGDQVDFG